MNAYGIKFRKGDVEIEIHGDKNFVESKFEELYSKTFGAIVHIKEKEIPQVEAPPKKQEAVETLSPEDVKEYMRMFKVMNNTQRIMVAARYLQEKLNKRSFTLADVKSVYKVMKWGISKNPSSFLQKFRQKKYIYPLPQKKGGKPLYVLTEKGVEFTESLKK